MNIKLEFDFDDDISAEIIEHVPDIEKDNSFIKLYKLKPFIDKQAWRDLSKVTETDEKPALFIWDHRKRPEIRIQKPEPIKMAEMSEVPDYVRTFHYYYLPTGTKDAVLGYQYRREDAE